MRHIEATIKGTKPLIMHNCQGANKMLPITKEIDKISSIRKKTDDDYEALSDLEWESGLYWRDGVGLYIPAENIEAMLVEGGKVRKRGTDIKKYAWVEERFIPVNIRENLTKEQMRTDYRFRDVRSMRVMQNRVMRTRPRFDTWECRFVVEFDESKIDVETLTDAINYAGKYVGLCDSRPKYGTFVAVIEETA